MADTPQSRNGEPTELVYVPEPSSHPALIAFGLAGVLVSVFTWWPYGVIGAIVMLVGIRAWIAEASSDYSKLPRRQRVATSVIPAVPLERERD
jgi:hypothetical protein